MPNGKQGNIRVTNRDLIRRDIDVLRESIREKWEKLSESDLTPETRAIVRTHIEECMDKLKAFRAEMDDADD